MCLFFRKLDWDIQQMENDFLLEGACRENVGIATKTVKKKHLSESKANAVFEKTLFGGDVKELVVRFAKGLPYTQKAVPCIDAVYGAMYGDIVGSRHEGKRMSRESALEDLWGSREYRYEYCLTDDSVLTLASADVIQNISQPVNISSDKNGMYCGETMSMFAESYKKFGKMYPDSGFGSVFVEWLCGNAEDSYGSNGNGSAMRISPVGASGFSVEDTVKLAIASSACTHNHIEGVRGACVEAVCIWLACLPENKTPKGKERIFEYMKEQYSSPGVNLFVDFTLEEVRQTYTYQVQCPFSVPASLIAFHESKSFEDAIVNAMYAGRDTDTNACICGAVAGAYYGVSDEIKNLVLERCNPHQKTVLENFEKYLERKANGN